MISYFNSIKLKLWLTVILMNPDKQLCLIIYLKKTWVNWQKILLVFRRNQYVSYDSFL